MKDLERMPVAVLRLGPACVCLNLSAVFDLGWLFTRRRTLLRKLFGVVFGAEVGVVSFVAAVCCLGTEEEEYDHPDAIKDSAYTVLMGNSVVSGGNDVLPGVSTHGPVPAKVFDDVAGDDAAAADANR